MFRDFISLYVAVIYTVKLLIDFQDVYGKQVLLMLSYMSYLSTIINPLKIDTKTYYMCTPGFSTQ